MGKFLDFLARIEKNYVLGFHPKTLKHHYSLIPIWVCNIVGVSWAIYFAGRTFLFNPDSSFLAKDNYERYRDGTYFKFFNITGYAPASNAPIYRREGDPSDESYELNMHGEVGPTYQHVWESLQLPKHHH